MKTVSYPKLSFQFLYPETFNYHFILPCMFSYYDHNEPVHITDPYT